VTLHAKNAYIAPVRLSTMRIVAVAVAAAILVGAGCAGSDDEASGPVASTPAGETTNGETDGATTTATDGIDPLEGAGTTSVTRPPAGEETALLEGIALGRHEGFDRIVFRFRNGIPGYRVEYVRPPLREDGSGSRVEVAGDAFVVVRMEPASGFDLTTGEGELVYTGPRRVSGSGLSVVREAVRTGDFEAVLSWAVGLADRVDFRVITLDDPARIVVDFRNH
jgi:hypothetical protein